MKFKLLFITLLACFTGWGQLSITSTGTAYTQYFDAFGSSPTASLPTGFRVNGNGVSPSWTTGTTATTAAGWTSGSLALTGTSTGGTYNFANVASSTDRALGFLTSGSYVSPNSIILRITNNTGVTVTNLNISFDYEKYRAGTRAWNLTFFHGNTVNPTIAETTGDQAYAVDGANAVVNPPTSITKTIALAGLSIANGTDYYLKWTSTGLAGSTNSQGIALDNFSITAYSPNPSPATLPYTQNFEGIYNEWSLGANSPNSWIVGSATNNGGTKALYVSNNGSANSYSDASSSTAQTIASFQVDLSNISNAQLAFDWRAIGEANFDYGDVWINTGGSDILISYMDPSYGDSDQFGEFCDNSGTNSSTYSNKVINIGAYVGGVVTIKFRWKCDGYAVVNPPFAVDNVSVSAIAPSITPPTVATESIGSITSTSASIGGNVSNQGTNNVTEKGICYSTTANPTISDNKITSGSGTGIYNVTLTNLAFQTHYYVRAYAITSAGVYYGTQMDFYTNAISAPVAATASNIAANTFTANWSSVSLATSYKLDVSTSSTTFTNYAPFSQFVTFDFENGNQNTVNSSLSNASNANTTIWAVGSGTLNYANEIGNGGEVKKVTGWDNGNGTKYWRINMSTYGMYNIKVSSKQRSDANGPKNWKLQYSIGQNGSENWIDITNSTITVADNYTSGILNQLQLPTAIENLAVVSLRWIMTSNTSINNGTVTNSGESNIDDILVFGESYQTLVVGYDNLTVNSTSKNITGLNPNSTYYYRVRSIASSSTSNNSNLITVTTLNNTTWSGSSWSNSSPTASIDAIIDGNLTTSTDLACKDLTINSGKTLTIGAGYKLTVSGNLINNGTIVFKSNASATAMFGVFNGTQSGSGMVTTERYIPAKRAFRFLSPSVTTTTSIKLNWQENAGTTAGLGTHITGVDGATNGFDATATNNPSLYTFDNSSGAWVAVTSTLSNTLTAGTPYRLMVRGDRLVNLTTNTPTTTETVLRATGTLKNGSFSPSLNQTAEGFSFVGNPYQAPVDIKAVLNAATNMNTGVVYYWDPTLNSRGGYVTRDLTANSNNVTSDFNQYLQPGQAVFVKKANTVSAASMTFTENHKSVGNAAAGAFRNANTNEYGILRVNLQANTNNQWATIDGALAIFNANFSWNVTSEDATKMTNLDEEVSFVQNNTNLAIALQNNPSASSELPVKIDKMRHTNYQWQFELDNYDGATPFLFDTLNNSYTQINNGTVMPFTADANTTNRFKIVFQNAVLSTDTFQNTIAIYPNPAKAGASFYFDGITEATVTVSNLLGQNVPVETKTQGNTLQVTPNTSLSQGVYLVNITTQGSTQQVKWIVE
jgi:hypothetical protein